MDVISSDSELTEHQLSSVDRLERIIGASAAVEALLHTPPRIRVRRTIVLRRQTGAIQLPYKNSLLERRRPVV